MKKRVIGLLMAAAMAAGLIAGCGAATQQAPKEKEEAEAGAENAENGEEAGKEEAEAEAEVFNGLTIVYTNDVHSNIANVIPKDKNDPNSVERPALRLSKVSQMVKDMKAEGREVLLVDAGDAVQGGIYGAIDEGESIIGLMNACGYDLATLGNHEFDYGMNRMFQLTDMAEFDYVCSNFHSLAEDSEHDPFAAYKLYETGGKTVALIGITTPESLSSAAPVYFQDAAGNYIYDFDGTKEPQDLYDVVQKTIDEVRGEADYVIALAHTGVADKSQQANVSSYDIIANTEGLDAYIDGHSHTKMEADHVQNKAGGDVLLTQTGYYLGAVGVMEISPEGEFSTRLVEEYEEQDPAVAELEEALIKLVDDEMGVEVGVLQDKLYTNNPDKEKQRLIRALEMNLGDFSADSVYWYLNEDRELDCDVAFSNGGGIRAELEAGPVKYIDVKNVHPFGNLICLVYASGQEILDALENGVTEIGKYNTEWDAPEENGGFLHVAGMRYSVDSSVPTSVLKDDTGMFVSADGGRRVYDVQIYDRKTGKYEPIDPGKTYTVGGNNFLIRNGGSGCSMFIDNDVVVDYIEQDWVILSDYVKSFAKDAADGAADSASAEGDSADGAPASADGELPIVNTKNSPLSAYEGYQLDYENPYGAGRITIK